VLRDCRFRATVAGAAKGPTLMPVPSAGNAAIFERAAELLEI
jgi:hypothetical protein